ncbi:hypothetical protein cyc_02721 [Cyclospora cayetanensis]|uniref:Uncharacterized protein n=1 Tax=Cyclospora cayetanensis TaxID=88456 RepID=A0A1D3CY96_9EIME|nr:hypothetical protein cyc_02721 [Cyclospora cayetanensis]
MDIQSLTPAHGAAACSTPVGAVPSPSAIPPSAAPVTAKARFDPVVSFLAEDEERLQEHIVLCDELLKQLMLSSLRHNKKLYIQQQLLPDLQQLQQHAESTTARIEKQVLLQPQKTVTAKAHAALLQQLFGKFLKVSAVQQVFTLGASLAAKAVFTSLWPETFAFKKEGGARDPEALRQVEARLEECVVLSRCCRRSHAALLQQFRNALGSAASPAAAEGSALTSSNSSLPPSSSRGSQNEVLQLLTPQQVLQVEHPALMQRREELVADYIALEHALMLWAVGEALEVQDELPFAAAARSVSENSLGLSLPVSSSEAPAVSQEELLASLRQAEEEAVDGGECFYSTMTEDLFFVFQASVSRALRSGDSLALCALLNHVAAALRCEVLTALRSCLEASKAPYAHYVQDEARLKDYSIINALEARFEGRPLPDKIPDGGDAKSPLLIMHYTLQELDGAAEALQQLHSRCCTLTIRFFQVYWQHCFQLLKKCDFDRDAALRFCRLFEIGELLSLPSLREVPELLGEVEGGTSLLSLQEIKTVLRLRVDFENEEIEEVVRRVGPPLS